MPSIKKYEKVNASNHKSSFSISKMEDIYAKRNGAADEPHRHNFYTVLVVKRAKGIHKIDFHSYDLAAGQVYFVAPSQVHQVIEQEQSFGFALTFSTAFLIEHGIRLAFIDRLNLFRNYGESPPLVPSDMQFERIVHFATEIQELSQGNSKLKMHAIASFLKLLLIECNEMCDIDLNESNLSLSGDGIIKAFKDEVAEQYKQEHSTTFYANQLHISADHLNRTIRDKLGKTAKEYIQARITTEAKRLLFFTDLSNKEIGFSLGFSEPAHFSAFFKKCTGKSPSAFKKEEHLA